MIVVEQGLEAGETVVTDGQMTVIPGGPVQVLTPAAPPTAVAADARPPARQPARRPAAGEQRGRRGHAEC